MSGTKLCPFCGEKIKSIAVKCRYCGEFLEGSPDSRQPGQDLVGQVIGEYRLTRKLGAGGMAEVYLGVHEEVGQQVATKVLNPGLARDPVVRERFIQEARIQIELRHPGIVRVLTVNTRGEHLALMMEYVEGRTLADIIGVEVGPVPIHQAQPLIEQVLSAMAHAHHQGVIHRDIKPSNILVSHDDVVKVMDFGIAKVVRATRLTRTGATLGTAVYMAPEQIQGSRDADERSDIYSLGVTFYEMLAGRPPFDGEGPGDSDFQVKLAHVNEAPPDPRQFYPDIPQAIVDVLMRALAKDPVARYQTVAAFQQGIKAATAGAPLARAPSIAQPATELEQPPAPARRVPATATLVEGTDRRRQVPGADTRPASRTGLYLGLGGGFAALLVLLMLLMSDGKDPPREPARTEPHTSEKAPSSAGKDEKTEDPEEKTAPPPGDEKTDADCKQSARCKKSGALHRQKGQLRRHGCGLQAIRIL